MVSMSKYSFVFSIFSLMLLLTSCEKVNSGKLQQKETETVNVAIPSGIKATKSDSYVTISWNRVAEATSYNIYRCKEASGSYYQIGMSNYTLYSDNSPMDGTNYYKVAAVNETGTSGLSASSNCITIEKVELPPCAPYVTGTANTEYVDLQWKVFSGSDCGRPTSIRIKVIKGFTSSVVANLPASTTSYRFSTGTWIDFSGTISRGTVTVEVTLINEYGQNSKRVICHI